MRDIFCFGRLLETSKLIRSVDAEIIRIHTESYGIVALKTRHRRHRPKDKTS